MGVLQALRVEMSLGLMRPSLKGVGFRGGPVGDEGDRRGPGRLFARWVRPERDLLLTFGAIVGGLMRYACACFPAHLVPGHVLTSNNETFPAFTISGERHHCTTKRCSPA